MAFEHLLNQGDKLAGAASAWLSERPGQSAACTHCDRRRDLRASPQIWRNGVGFCAAHDRTHRRVRLTNYGNFSPNIHRPMKSKFASRTAWSCAHGIERWASDCGCNSGGSPGWHQRWRTPLRTALDLLRDRLAPFYEQATATLLSDPWRARDAYIDVTIDGRPEVRERFCATAMASADPDETARVFQLLEMQRHLLLMYTSCGWFSTTSPALSHCKTCSTRRRRFQLAQTALKVDLEPAFSRRAGDGGKQCCSGGQRAATVRKPGQAAESRSGQSICSLRDRVAVPALRRSDQHLWLSDRAASAAPASLGATFPSAGGRGWRPCDARVGGSKLCGAALWRSQPRRRCCRDAARTFWVSCAKPRRAL